MSFKDIKESLHLTYMILDFARSLVLIRTLVSVTQHSSDVPRSTNGSYTEAQTGRLGDFDQKRENGRRESNQRQEAHTARSSAYGSAGIEAHTIHTVAHTVDYVPTHALDEVYDDIAAAQENLLRVQHLVKSNPNAKTTTYSYSNSNSNSNSNSSSGSGSSSRSNSNSNSSSSSSDSTAQSSYNSPKRTPSQSPTVCASTNNFQSPSAAPNSMADIYGTL